MPRGRGNPLGTTSGARCEDSRACARPLPRSHRPEEGTARPGGFLRTTGQDRGGGGRRNIRVSPRARTPHGGRRLKQPLPTPPCPPIPAAPGPSLTPQGGHLVGAEGGGGGAPWRAAAAEQQQAARQEPQPHAQHRLSRHGSARPGPAPTRSSPRREPGPGEGGGATPPRGGRGERGSRPRSFPGRGAPPRARCPGRGWG